MLKKTLLVVGGVGLLGVLLVGSNALSYVRTSCGWVRQSVKNSVPIKFEIERARRLCKDLRPAIRDNMELIAKEEVEVEQLADQIARGEKRMEKEKADLMTLRTDLDSSQNFYVYAGRKYTEKQVRGDLAARLERFKTGQETLDNLTEVQRARARSLEAARQKLEGMLAAKRQLEVDVENLEARMKMVEVAQTTSEYNIDDSQLGRVKELVSDVRARLMVAEKLAHADQYFRDEIPVSEADESDVVANFDEYFEINRPGAEAVAVDHIKLD